MRDAVVVLDEAYASFYNKDTSYLKEILDQFQICSLSARFQNIMAWRVFALVMC